MDILFNKLKDNINAKKYNPCITGNILQGNIKQFSAITEQELRSICLTMVSAGLDAIPSTVVSCVGHLSQPAYGLEIQKRAFQEIIETYPKGDAWSRCVNDNYIPYILMLIKETLRYSSSQPLSLPRQTVKDINYKKTIIPSGTILFMNSLAANFDASHFDDPFKFNPERFRYCKAGAIEHMGFGAGSRMCAGAKLAERELYVILVRLITKFKISPPSNKADLMQTDIFENFKTVSSMVVEPKPFFVRLDLR